METILKDISPTKKEIKVIIPFEDIDPFIKEATKKLIQDLEIKGFRKGNVPEKIALEHIDKDNALRQGAFLSIQKNYPQIIQEKKIEPLGAPQVEIMKLAYDNPLEFKLTFSILPKITLPDYKEIAKKFSTEPVLVTDEDIEKAFQQLQSIKDSIPEEERKRINFDNPEELKKILRQDLKKQKEVVESRKTREDILKEISKNCEIEVPEPLVITEKEKALEDLKKTVSQNLKMTFEDYLKNIKKTEEELQDSLEQEIKERIKKILILGEIQKLENIVVDNNALEQEVKLAMDSFTQQNKAQSVDQQALRSYIKEKMEQEKTLQFLEEIRDETINQ